MIAGPPSRSRILTTLSPVTSYASALDGKLKIDTGWLDADGVERLAAALSLSAAIMRDSRGEW